jgi:hypothetical protein
MLVDKLFFSNFYLHWFFSNLSFIERDPHMDVDDVEATRALEAHPGAVESHFGVLEAYPGTKETHPESWRLTQDP